MKCRDDDLSLFQGQLSFVLSRQRCFEVTERSKRDSQRAGDWNVSQTKLVRSLWICGCFVLWKCAHWTCETASYYSLILYITWTFLTSPDLRCSSIGFNRVWCYIYHYFWISKWFKNKEELNDCRKYYEILSSDFESTRYCNFLKGKFSYRAIIAKLWNSIFEEYSSVSILVPN